MASTNTEDNGHVTYPRPLIFEGPCPKPEDVRFSVEVDEATVQAVERQTRGQRENPDWLAWCRYRIDDSMAHIISHSYFANGRHNEPPEDYVQRILGEGPNLDNIPAIKWGLEYKAQAVQNYQELKSASLRHPVKVQPCGLFINPRRVWLAASPDGIVEDEQTGERLLCLVKCPYKHRENTLRVACLDKDFCLELQGQKYRLKTKHRYYTQVHCQMAVTGIHMADLEVFTLHEAVFVPVTFDPQFWKDTVAKLEIFYRGILPRLPLHIHNA